VEMVHAPVPFFETKRRAAASLRAGDLGKWVPQVALPVKTKMTEVGKKDAGLEGAGRQTIAHRCTATQPPRN